MIQNGNSDYQFHQTCLAHLAHYLMHGWCTKYLELVNRWEILPRKENWLNLLPKDPWKNIKRISIWENPLFVKLIKTHPTFVSQYIEQTAARIPIKIVGINGFLLLDYKFQSNDHSKSNYQYILSGSRQAARSLNSETTKLFSFPFCF